MNRIALTTRVALNTLTRSPPHVHSLGVLIRSPSSLACESRLSDVVCPLTQQLLLQLQAAMSLVAPSTLRPQKQRQVNASAVRRTYDDDDGKSNHERGSDHQSDGHKLPK